MNLLRRNSNFESSIVSVISSFDNQKTVTIFYVLIYYFLTLTNISSKSCHGLVLIDFVFYFIFIFTLTFLLFSSFSFIIMIIVIILLLLLLLLCYIYIYIFFTVFIVAIAIRICFSVFFVLLCYFRFFYHFCLVPGKLGRMGNAREWRW